MSDEEIEKLAELIFQKLVKKEQEYIDNMELPDEEGEGWTASTTDGIWYTFSFNKSVDPEPNDSSKVTLMQKLISLNIEKQELIEKEDYEELIKLQKRIDEIKEQ